MNVIKRIWKRKYELHKIFFRKLVRSYEVKYQRSKVTDEEQSRIYELVGLDRSAGVKRLISTLANSSESVFFEDDGMYSEHLAMCAAISVSSHQINQVLEIGTHDGRAATILADLFPDAIITTIDLPNADPDFSSTYQRDNDATSFIKKRDHLLSKSENIKFLQINSLGLANFKDSFDLIWIDGAHGYPVVSMDVINSYRLCNQNGFVLIDDVWIDHPEESDQYYKSIGAFQSLSSLKDANLIKDFTLFNKRLAGQYNTPWEKKFVGFFRKQ
ncbi:class I SAM-dependent methyltransferase [Gammaproteobacteria bacterium]|nr:class I SAM-dependent methyltransferase [Gammaproteobacteria bacterium]